MPEEFVLVPKHFNIQKDPREAKISDDAQIRSKATFYPYFKMKTTSNRFRLACTEQVHQTATKHRDTSHCKHFQLALEGGRHHIAHF